MGDNQTYTYQRKLRNFEAHATPNDEKDIFVLISLMTGTST